jgi:hypothetical protein
LAVKFGRLGRSGNFGGEEVSKDLKGGGSVRILSPLMNVFLQLHVHCVCFLSGDFLAKKLSTVLLLFFMLFIYVII